jgi:2-dehydropantoate 2-reductase
MKVAVAGAGAVGGLVAWHLAAAGANPVLLARPEAAERIAREGLIVAGPDFETARQVRVVTDARELGEQNVLIGGFKAQDWPTALPALAPLIGPGTVVVPLLNGIPWWYFADRDPAIPVHAVDPKGQLLAAIDPAAILGAVVYVGTHRTAPNRIVWNGRKRFVLGRVVGAPAAAALPAALAEQGSGVRGPFAVDQTLALPRSADIGTEKTADIRGEVWMKLLGNLTYNPISALTGAVMGAIAADPDLRALARSLMEEAVAVARAYGVTRPFDIEDRLNLSPPMRGSETSILQDMKAGRPLELGGIVEAVAELGAVAGVPTPTVTALCRLTAGAARLRRP